MQRQRALAEGNRPMFRYLRNRVNRERKTCREQYYESKVDHLKDCKPSVWWKEIKRLSSMSSAVKDREELKQSLQLLNGYSSAPDLVKLINDAFLSPNTGLHSPLRRFLPCRGSPRLPSLCCLIRRRLSQAGSTRLQKGVWSRWSTQLATKRKCWSADANDHWYSKTHPLRNVDYRHLGSQQTLCQSPNKKLLKMLTSTYVPSH